LIKNSNNEHIEHLNKLNKNKKNMIYNKIANWCLYLTVFLIPLFFLPWTLDPLEINKQTLLVILILFTCLAMAGASLVKNQISFKKSFVNLLTVVFLIFCGLSAFFSGSHFLSWAGASGQEYTSFVSILSFVALFWLISCRIKEQNNFSKIVLFLTGGAIIAGLIGLLQIFGVFLPFSFAQTTAFNTVGTLNSLGLFLAIVTVLANTLFIVWNGKGRVVPSFTIVLSVITFVFLVVNSYFMIWLVFLFGLSVILFLVFWRAHELHHTKKYLLPMLMVGGAIFFTIINVQLPISVPAEVLPNTATSLAVARQTMTETKQWFGSGPGTYLFDYTKFRPNEVNSTSFWSIRFTEGSSGFLTLLPTLGLLPLLVLGLLTITLGIIAAKRFIKREEEQWLAFTIIPAWLTAILSFFLYPTNFTLAFLFFLLSGMIGALINGKVKTFSLVKSPKTKIIVSVGFTALAVVTITILFLAMERFSAEYTFAKAVRMDRDGANLQEIIKKIDSAATINRFNDLYYRNLAEALVLEVGAQLSSLENQQTTDEQNAYLQGLVSASINAGKKATTLEPRNVANWLELGSVYRAFTPIMEEAGGFAISSFETAISLEPSNPENYIELGKAYLTIASSLEPQTISPNSEEKKAAQTKRAEAFTAAEAAFNKAIELKPDYAHAHYEIALAYEQQGRLNEAIGKMESINTYNPEDVGVAFELGILYLRRLGDGDLPRAEKVLNQAVELLPSYSNAHWYLAFAYEQQGKIEAAIAEVEKVLELNPNNELVKSRLDGLKNGKVSETAVEPIE
jgi:cytochrome c-type biogenesis protein CcmH/NrfG